MDIILADGTALKNIVADGTCFVSSAPINRGLFEDNLTTVTINDTRIEDIFNDNGEKVDTVTYHDSYTLKNAKLTLFQEIGGKGYVFMLEEKTAAEIDRERMEAQIFYTAMLTDTIMEDMENEQELQED